MEALKPFQSVAESLAVKADFSLRGTTLDLRFALGDANKLVLDSLVPGTYSGAELARADELWKTTCFEAFWSLRGNKGYWEFNMAGSGKKWNCYAFDDYREPSPPESCLDFELKRVTVTAESLECSLRGKTVLPDLDVSLCAILRTAAGIYYFSTAHVDEKPNFHARQSFTLRRRQP